MMGIPAGPFAMGSEEYADEEPVHEVYLDDYLIDRARAWLFKRHMRSYARKRGCNPDISKLHLQVESALENRRVGAFFKLRHLRCFLRVAKR